MIVCLHACVHAYARTLHESSTISNIVVVVSRPVAPETRGNEIVVPELDLMFLD